MKKELFQELAKKQELLQESMGRFLEGAVPCMACGKPANRMVCHITNDDTEFVILCAHCHAREKERKERKE